MIKRIAKENMSMTTRPDFSDIPEQAIDEIYRAAEMCVQGTIQLAIAADQRATTMAAIFGAGSMALLTVAATIKASSFNDPALIWAVSTTAASLFIATLMCALSSRPIDFFIGGYEPIKYAKCAGDPVWMKRYASEDLQVRIDANRDVLRRAGNLLSGGAIIAAISPFIGIFVYFVS